MCQAAVDILEGAVSGKASSVQSLAEATAWTALLWELGQALALFARKPEVPAARMPNAGISPVWPAFAPRVRAAGAGPAQRTRGRKRAARAYGCRVPREARAPVLAVACPHARLSIT